MRFTHTYLVMNKKRFFGFTRCFFAFVFIAVYLLFSSSISTFNASAMPFYDLKPQNIVVRAEFFTSYPASSDERKHNIKLAASAINGFFLDVGAEFSFNETVGERSREKGYKQAKIIYNGKFTDGIGGGVCQVSTTLYNAALLAGLKITEFHPHSLPVSYIAPSFDAMVNSSCADLRFVNNTHNPVIIETSADDAVLRVKIHGEPMTERFVRQSRIIEGLPASAPETIIDEKGEYPDLFKGEKRVLSYGRNGYKSEGVLIKTINGKLVSSQVIRTDKYNPISGVIVEGTAIPDKNIGDKQP